MNTDQMKGNWKQLSGKLRKNGASQQTTIGKSSRENAISLLVEFRSAMELLANKQSVR